MNNELFVKELYYIVSDRKGNKPFLLDEIFINKEITEENKNYLNSLINKGSFFLKKNNENKLFKTYRIQEICERTIKELEKENYNSDILELLKNNPEILHSELKRWFDTKHDSMGSYVLDKYWHNFVLYAKEYEDWCYENYQCYLYHTPKFPYQNTILSDEEIIQDVAKYFKLYTKKHKLDNRVLLYNLPLLMYKKDIPLGTIKEILLELIV